jgi:hypothetical protein
MALSKINPHNIVSGDTAEIIITGSIPKNKSGKRQDTESPIPQHRCRGYLKTGDMT